MNALLLGRTFEWLLVGFLAIQKDAYESCTPVQPLVLHVGPITEYAAIHPYVRDLFTRLAIDCSFILFPP